MKIKLISSIFAVSAIATSCSPEVQPESIATATNRASNAKMYKCTDKASGNVANLEISGRAVNWNEPWTSASSEGRPLGKESAPFSEFKGYELFHLTSFLTTEDSFYVLALNKIVGNDIKAAVYFDNDDHQEEVTSYDCTEITEANSEARRSKVRSYICEHKESGNQAKLEIGTDGVNWDEPWHSAESQGQSLGQESAPFSEFKGYELFHLTSFLTTEDSFYVLALEKLAGNVIKAAVYFDNDDFQEEITTYICKKPTR